MESSLDRADGGAGPGAVSAIDGAKNPSRLVKSAERTIEILELLAASDGPLTSVEIHKLTGYPRSSLHWLLLTLVNVNWLDFLPESSSYKIGAPALICGTSYLDKDPVMEFAPAILEEVRNLSSYTTHFARLNKGDVIYLATRQAVDLRRFSSRVGRQLPASATALGKALLAERTFKELQLILGERPFEKLTEHSVGNIDDLEVELQSVRARGFAVEHEQNTLGVVCVSAVVPYRIPATDAVSCSIPVQSATPEEIERVSAIVTSSARALSRLLISAGIR